MLRSLLLALKMIDTFLIKFVFGGSYFLMDNRMLRGFGEPMGIFSFLSLFLAIQPNADKGDHIEHLNEGLLASTANLNLSFPLNVSSSSLSKIIFFTII